MVGGSGASGTFSFAAGELSKTVAVGILGDDLVEGPQVFRLVLTNPTGGATLEGLTMATVTIGDDDNAGQVQFAAVATAGAENASATVTVTRKGGSASGVSVNYATFGGTSTWAQTTRAPPEP